MFKRSKARSRKHQRKPSFLDEEELVVEGTGQQEETISIEQGSEEEEEIVSGEEVVCQEESKPTRRRRPLGRRERKERFKSIDLIAWVIGFGALLTFVLSIPYTRINKIDFSNVAFFFVLFTLCAHFDVELKSGLKLNLGLAPLVGALLSLPIKEPTVEVLWLFLIGSVVTLFIKMMGEIDKEKILSLLFDYTSLGVSAVIYRMLVSAFPEKPLLLGKYTPWMLVAIAFAASIIFIGHVFRSAYVLSREGLFPAGAYFSSVIKRYWIPFLGICFLGVLMGLVFLGIGMWSVLFILPLLAVIMYAYNRVAKTDEYLLDTIRTLAAIPEETGRVEKGHAEKVATIAKAVAQELGLGPEDARQVEFAAYLHDIGAITKQESVEQRQLTEMEGVISGGVDIIGKVDYLQVAAEILKGREGLSDRVVDFEKRRAVSIGSGILKAVDDFVSLVSGSAEKEPMSESEALTEMNLERGVKYDSKVLRAIARVLPGISEEGSVRDVEDSSEGSSFWRDS